MRHEFTDALFVKHEYHLHTPTSGVRLYLSTGGGSSFVLLDRASSVVHQDLEFLGQQQCVLCPLV